MCGGNGECSIKNSFGNSADGGGKGDGGSGDGDGVSLSSISRPHHPNHDTWSLSHSSIESLRVGDSMQVTIRRRRSMIADVER